MADTVPPIRIGTCGWSYKDWVGPFYPKGLAPADYLPYYAEHFPIVEVDSTFYRSPSKSMVQGWRDKTPEGFSFSLKVPQTIPHEKVLVDCAGEVEEFVSAARLLGDKLLCCTLQFGYFNRQAFAGPDEFVERLDSFLGECLAHGHYRCRRDPQQGVAFPGVRVLPSKAPCSLGAQRSEVDADAEDAGGINRRGCQIRSSRVI
jgi:hypothetical protein